MNSSSPGTGFLERLQRLEARLRPIWHNGRPPKNDPKAGPHWVFPGTRRPVSVGCAEAFFLSNVARASCAVTAFEIGTGFGFSSWWLAQGLEGREGSWLGSIDDYSEGKKGRDRFDFACLGAKLLDMEDRMRYFIGVSPVDVVKAVGSRTLDLAFIDGGHHGEQPVLDYLALEPFLADNSLLIFHDVNPRYSVGEAVRRALHDGWRTVRVPSSCDIVVCYRRSDAISVVESAYLAATEHRLVY